MEIQIRCPYQGCNLIAPAAYWEEAREKIRSHFRLNHPTKVLNETRLAQEFETFNLTFGEYWGAYYPEMPLEGAVPTRIIEVCRRLRRNAHQFNPEVVQEAIALSAAHGRVLEPFVPENDLPHNLFLYQEDAFDQDFADDEERDF